MGKPTTIAMHEPATPAQIGGKAMVLSRLHAKGFSSPPWVVLTPAAFTASLDAQQRKAFESSDDPEAVRQVIDAVRVSDAVAEELTAKLRTLGLEDRLLAVRSSAVDEDGSDQSFAGQFESYLATPMERVAQRIADVWRSGFTPRVLAYRRQHGLSVAPRPPAVLVQEFVDAEAAGVAFGADPVSGRRGHAVVSAVWGLGSALVTGDANADTWRIDRSGQIVDREIAQKSIKHSPAPKATTGTKEEPIDTDHQQRPALSDHHVRSVAKLVRRTGEHFSVPQDIEWALRDGELLLLQSRPITSLRRLPDPDGRLQLWDNSNIAESYSGITTPLTFTFARHAYEGVYRQFCLLLRVPKKTVREHADTFANMLGLVRGRVYYNLLSWYRMLSLLPGFAANRKFMEQMMGVSRSLPAEMLWEFESAGRAQQWRDRFRLVRVGGALVGEHFRLRRSIHAFYERLNRALREPQPPLRAMRLDELVDEYAALERSLITRWDAPLVNDFLAMIFFGLLRSLTAKWGGDEGGQLHNHLLCAEGGIISVEPAQRINTMAKLAREDSALVQTLCQSDADQAMTALAKVPELKREFDAYREKFGDRCLEELKLESRTLDDDPTPLLRSVGYAAKRETTDTDPGKTERRMRQQAEVRIKQALERHPLRRAVFGWVLKHARARIRDRENLRFERTRLFGRVRRIFVEIGRRLTAETVLSRPRDVFYLEVDEVIGFVRGTATCTDLAKLAEVRRREFEQYEQSPPPAGRFRTRGAVPIGNDYSGQEQAPEAVDGESSEAMPTGEDLRGIGACPGVVQGTVRIIRDPRGIELTPGAIVVAERTDPGWIMVLPAATGMLVEHGSLLSHSAIVSRELGVPSIVSIPEVTTRLHDGQRVEMDGRRGTVRLLHPDTEHDGADRSE